MRVEKLLKSMDENNKTFYSKSFTVTVSDNRVSVFTNPSSLALNMDTNNSATVRVNISGQYGGIGGGGSGDNCITAEWVDSGSGYAVAKFTAAKTGVCDYTFKVYDDTKTNVIATTTIRITVTAPTYTVSYNANGGNGAPSSQIKTKDTALTLSLTEPTRPGYTFLGWSASPSSMTSEYQPGCNFYEN